MGLKELSILIGLECEALDEQGAKRRETLRRPPRRRWAALTRASIEFAGRCTKALAFLQRRTGGQQGLAFTWLRRLRVVTRSRPRRIELQVVAYLAVHHNAVIA